MTLQVTIQEGHLWLAAGEESIALEPVVLKAAA
jgi:uncharacterized protein YaeQ